MKSTYYIDENIWPTISEAVKNVGAIQRAIYSGAYKVNEEKHFWMYKGKLVTEEFLRDYFS